MVKSIRKSRVGLRALLGALAGIQSSAWCHQERVVAFVDVTVVPMDVTGVWPLIANGCTMATANARLSSPAQRPHSHCVASKTHRCRHAMP